MDDLRESFLIEASDLLDDAERCLLLVEKGESLQRHFNIIFRAFHSVKGGASMFEMKSAQSLLHDAETRLDGFRKHVDLTSDTINYFLQALNKVRADIYNENGESLAEPVVETKKTEPQTAKINAVKPTPTMSQQVSKPKVRDNRLRALIVDDEPELTEVLFDVLDDAGFSAKVFNDPTAALRSLEEFKPEVLLCDMKMPQMIGLDFLKEIKRMRDAPPLIFISGYLTKEILIEAVNLGAEGVIEKPFDEKFIVKLAKNAAIKKRSIDSFNRTINLMLYQYSEFDDFLKQVGKDHVKKMIDEEINTLIEQRSILRDLTRGAA